MIHALPSQHTLIHRHVLPQRPEHFGQQLSPAVSAPKGSILASPVEPQNNFLWLYKVRPQGHHEDWWFAHEPKNKAGVSALTLTTDGDGQQYVNLIKMKRPSMDGKVTLELPGGGVEHWEDNIQETIQREAHEETGLSIQKVEPLGRNVFATTPSMVTYKRGFGIAYAEGTISHKNWDVGEQKTIQEIVQVPLETFTNYDYFMEWLDDMHREDIIVGMDVIAARGLMPPAQRLDLQA